MRILKYDIEKVTGIPWKKKKRENQEKRLSNGGGKSGCLG